MARRVQVLSRRKSVVAGRDGMIVKACEGALEQLESRQLLSAVGNLSTPTTVSGHVRHVAHLKHLNHLKQMSKSSLARSTSVSSLAAVAASTPVAASPPPAFTVIQ